MAAMEVAVDDTLAGSADGPRRLPQSNLPPERRPGGEREGLASRWTMVPDPSTSAATATVT
jgi:hypothetical protein